MNIKVKGGQVLSGEIHPSGSKNSAVALIPSTILFDKPVTLENIPNITDVTQLVSVMEKLGSKIDWNKKDNSMQIDNSNLRFENLDKEDLGSMKGTSLLWGPMLARFGEVNFTELPRGCKLGFRTLDPHYSAFKDLGVQVGETYATVKMDAKDARASEIWLTEMSPTATENAVMFATSLKGKTKIIGSASEPQVQDLCEFLIKCGAKIDGVGSSVLIVEGGQSLTPGKHTLLSDHYEIATFIALGVITGGKIKVHNALPGRLQNLLSTFSKFGITLHYEGDTLIYDNNQKVKIQDDSGRGTLTVKAQPWPALPVDAMPLFIPLALVSKGEQVLFHNWMYDAGLYWTSELQKMGANIIVCDPHRVVIMGGNKLKGAYIDAPYIIRAVVAMVMAGMVAEGETFIRNADALYRGHPNFSANLKSIGAQIEEVE